MGSSLFPTVFWCNASQKTASLAPSLFNVAGSRTWSWSDPKASLCACLTRRHLVSKFKTRSLLRGTEGSNPAPSIGEMVWGRRRDFLPGSQEVKWRDGNPPTNATVPAP